MVESTYRNLGPRCRARPTHRGVLCQPPCRSRTGRTRTSGVPDRRVTSRSGCWRATARDGQSLEFMPSAERQGERHVLIMGMIAYYHVGPSSDRLDLAHTVRIGEPWTAGSVLDHLLVFLPYACGPHLEHLEWQTGPARLLSVMPIPRRSATSKPEKAPTHSSNYLRMVKQPSPTHCDPQRSEQPNARPLVAVSGGGAQPSVRLGADEAAS